MGLTRRIKRQKMIYAVIAGCLSMIIVSVLALAVTTAKPYFKTYGADVFSGGWFNSGTSCDTAANSLYQDPSYSPTGYTPDERTGGILSFAKKDAAGNSLGGASSQYGAFALGTVEGIAGNDADNHGFYSAGVGAPTTKNLLTFANGSISANMWGGKFDGSVRQSNCIPDYYAKLPSTGTQPLLPPLNSSTATGTYTASAGGGNNYLLTPNNSAVNLSSGTSGTKITIYVNGNVFISQNIVYQLDKVDNVPKFTLVAKGNIFIDPGVTRLDGLYIAQPTSGTSGGDIWTCHQNNTDVVLYIYPSGCTNQLVINGSLIAKRVEFLRTQGNVADASTSEDSLSTGVGSSHVAEVINYSPAMVVGGPFFNPAPSNSLFIDSIISLPPVF